MTRPTRTIASSLPLFELDRLEQRRLLAATPDGLRAATELTWDDRQALLDAMPNITSQSRKDILQGRIDQRKAGAFDYYLQEWMEFGPLGKFFFDPDEVQGRADYLKDPSTGINVQDGLDNAEAVAFDRLLPDGEGGANVVSTGPSIDFNSDYGRGANFFHGTQRLSWFPDQAAAARMQANGDEYAEDLDYQLARFHQQYPDAGVPSFWAESDQRSYQLGASIRAEYFAWTYFTLIGGDYMADNVPSLSTLLLLKIKQHGDYLLAEGNAALGASDLGDNRTLTLAKSLHTLGVAFPEFADAPQWEAVGRTLLFQEMDTQLYDDGSHYEQSPGYAQGIVEDLLDAYVLDDRNGKASEWSGGRLTKLENAIDTYNQFVTPDGRRPALSDTYATTSVTLYYSAAAALGNLTSESTTITSISGDPATQTTFSVADGSIFSVGDHVMERGKTEVMRIENVSGNTITVDRYFAGVSTFNGLANGEELVNFGDIPLAKPRSRDAWIFGPDATRDFTQFPALGVVGERGTFADLPDSGNYIFRNQDETKQLTFDAGPKGGVHGHYDLFNLTLHGGDRPLIEDPGPYYYADVGDPEYADRQVAVSTRAHNTINLDTENTGQIEADSRDGIDVWENRDAAGGRIVSATHNAYNWMAGAPALTRSVWSDGEGTFLVVDRVKSAAAHDIEVNFTLDKLTSTGFRSSIAGATSFGTESSTGSNVWISSYDQVGQDIVTRSTAFVTDTSEPDYKRDARRYEIRRQNAAEAVFVTMIQAYDGTTRPDVGFSLASTPGADDAFSVQLTRGGVGAESVPFAAAPLDLLGPAGFDRDAADNDIEYGPDGTLHLVYFDRGGDASSTGRGLKYAKRDPDTGVWSAVMTIDDSAPDVGRFPDLKIDKRDRPGVAYFDGTNGDLKYAHLDPWFNTWKVDTIDTKQSVGLYPSLAFTRNAGGPMIAYYHKNAGELRVATQVGYGQWDIERLDGMEDLGADGDVGRFANIALDPNRTDLNSRYVVSYEDTTRGTFRYGYFYQGNFKHETIDPAVGVAGGYLSMDFVDTGTGTDDNAQGDKWQPVFSYYASVPDTGLKYTYRTSNGVAREGSYTSLFLAAEGPGRKAGLYSRMRVVDNRPDIFYFDIGADLLMRVTQGSDGRWSYETLADGGRQVRVDAYGSELAFTNLDAGRLTLTTRS